MGVPGWDVERSRGRKILAALVASAILLAGCAVTLVSPYDDTTDRGITALARSIDSLLLQLSQEPTPAYSTAKPTYDAIRADLKSLIFRNEARSNNALTVRQLGLFVQQLDTFEGQHRGGTLTPVMIGPARDAFEQTLRAILKLELAKKELKQKN